MTVQILLGDCRKVLATLPAGSVHTCVTSPPYFALRDYECDDQIGLEPTPEAFVAELVGVFREVRRVLRDDGTLWLNIGDSYATNAGQGTRGGPPSASSTLQGNGHRGGGPKLAKLPNGRRGRSGNLGNGGVNGVAIPERRARPHGDIKPKDMIGIPWMLAFALRSDGWFLRQDIIWHKPNPMPESVQDRCTKAHEYVFLLSKGPRYYYDADAISEAASPNTHARVSQDVAQQIGSQRAHGGSKTMKAVIRAPKSLANAAGSRNNASFNDATAGVVVQRRNKRSVWTVGTEPFSEAHFATFPPGLIEPCIMAGAPGGGVVLDPFGGAGTTGLVAERLGRDSILIELNAGYAEIARRRLRAGLAQVSMAPVEVTDAGPLFAGAAA